MKEVLEVEVPQEIQVQLNGYTVKLTKGDNSLDESFVIPKLLFKNENNKIFIELNWTNKKERAVLNTIRSKIRNMVQGLMKGYVAECEVVFSHFPMTVTKKDKIIEINNFLGGKNVSKSKIVGKTDVKIDGKIIHINGISKENVSQTAANLEKATKVRHKDNRVYSDGIYITKKAH